MYIVRDIFNLKFGHYRDVKALLDSEQGKKLFSQMEGLRILTDFTGDSYRMVWEMPFPSLAEYEKQLREEFAAEGWQEWYAKFKQYVNSSHREILKQMS